MKTKYNEKKATQVAALILKRKGGKMDLIDLMKTIYCVDREALVKYRWPLTGDRYSALKRGMVLSHTYDLAKGDFALPTHWGTYIKREDGSYELKLDGDPGVDELSLTEIELVNDVLDNLENVPRTTMIEKIHHSKFPEWKDPGSSSFTVLYEDVLAAEGLNSDEINTFVGQVEVHSMFECF